MSMKIYTFRLMFRCVQRTAVASHVAQPQHANTCHPIKKKKRGMNHSWRRPLILARLGRGLATTLICIATKSAHICTEVA